MKDNHSNQRRLTGTFTAPLEIKYSAVSRWSYLKASMSGQYPVCHQYTTRQQRFFRKISDGKQQ